MKASNRILFAISIALAFGLKLTTAQAVIIPGYIGPMSFRLSDDREMANYEQAIESAKVEYVRIDQSRSQLQDQSNLLSREVEKIRADLLNLHDEIQSDKVLLKSFQDKLIVLNQNAEQNADEITTTQLSIDRYTVLINNKTSAYGKLKLDMAPLNVRLDQINNDLNEVIRRTEMARNKMLQLRQEFEAYERKLISEIQKFNRDGANRGNSDGASDGSNYAKSLGHDKGSREGQIDGNIEGRDDGQLRDYRLGADQGDRDGSSRAQIDGQRDGTLLGTRDGNISAANREGSEAGIKRAESSDAAKVGVAQGNKAGLNRAILEGRINGEASAESESLQKFESTPLNEVKLNGPFAGSFQRRSPSYPGDFNGANYHPDIWVNKDILKRAYADGYIYLYRDQARRAFNNNIDAAYNHAYDTNFNSAYQIAYNIKYTDKYNEGRSDGDKKAYERDYSVIKNNFYRELFARFDANPNRLSEEFKGTYVLSEKNSFADRYERIRKASFDKEELITFKSNILAQTESSKARRNTEVAKVFNDNAILAFEKSEVLDGGINGVAKLDGVFQAGEKTLHNLVIKNFGFREALSVKVKLDNGSEVLMPSIPARSRVLVIGAGLSQVSSMAELGSTQKSTLQVLSSLTSNDAIEGIHFDKMGSGILKSADFKLINVQYPFSLASLKIDSVLIKDQKNKLKISVSNNSLRSYSGDLKIELLANSQNNLIIKSFGNINLISNGSTVELADAEILVIQDQDIYRDLSISAKISQNGVVLGVQSVDLSVMAKSAYIEKGKLPVLVVDSNKDLNYLKDILGDFGGSENVSILDLSLPELNSSIVNNGLVGKTVLVLDDSTNKTILSLNTLIAKSKTTSFVLVNENGSGLGAVLSLPSLKNSFALNLDKRVIRFTNPYMSSGVVESTSLIAATKSGIPSVLVIANVLSLSAQEHIAKMKTEINRNNVFMANDVIKLFSLKAMSEILTINLAYDKSGHIFSRDKKWAEKVSNDGNLFINQLKTQAAGNVVEDKLGVIFSAIALKDFVSTAMSDFYDISKEMMPKIQNATNKVLGNMEDSYKKGLKDFNKDLYNKVYDKISIQRPFYIEPKPEQN